MTYTVMQTVKALGHRTSGIMFVFGFAAGLPNVLVIGTLNAWLSQVGVDLATIGILSWAGLAYAFKFLWSPVVDRVRPPLLGRLLGQRRGWILLCQIVIAGALLLISQTDPRAHLPLFAAAAVAAAFASATQDVVIDAWRIEVATDHTPLDLLSTVYQFGYRIASLLGGAGALFLAASRSWPSVYLLMTVLMVCALCACFGAPEPDATKSRAVLPPDDAFTQLSPQVRNRALALVLCGWAWAITTLACFMISVLNPDPNATTPVDARQFTNQFGPWIVLATVIAPGILAAWLNAFKKPAGCAQSTTPLQNTLDYFYGAIISPLGELVQRMGIAAVLALMLILTYRITDSIWGPFAFPFYLQALHYSNEEVALASKIIGVVMTMVGIALGGLAMLRLGHMPTLIIGAISTAASNLLFADLATGGHGIDGFLSHTGLTTVLGFTGLSPRMMRLVWAIAVENIASGFAGAAFVAYLSSITSRNFSAVQYALLSSLTFLIGALGRGALGQMIEEQGYAVVFRFCAVLGLFAVVLCVLEWVRRTHYNRPKIAP